MSWYRLLDSIAVGHRRLLQMLAVLGLINVIDEGAVEVADPLEEFCSIGLAFFSVRKNKNKMNRCTSFERHNKILPILHPSLIDYILFLRFLEFFQSFVLVSKSLLKFNTNFSLVRLHFRVLMFEFNRKCLQAFVSSLNAPNGKDFSTSLTRASVSHLF